MTVEASSTIKISMYPRLPPLPTRARIYLGALLVWLCGCSVASAQPARPAVRHAAAARAGPASVGASNSHPDPSQVFGDLAALSELSPPEPQRSHSRRPSRWALHPFTSILTHTKDAFSGDELWLHGAAVASTVVLVQTDIDGDAQTYFGEENPIGQTFADATFIYGGGVHAGVATVFFVSGLFYPDLELQGAGAAALQALGLTLVVVDILKLVTGRPGPPRAACVLFCDPDQFTTTNAQDFNFDWWNQSVWERELWYWPSGHTATSFAFASALASYYPHLPWVGWLGYTGAAMVGLGLIEGDFHWLSDVIAGALIGFAIGHTVGSGFRAAYTTLQQPDQRVPESQKSWSWLIVPQMTGNHRGIGVALHW